MCRTAVRVSWLNSSVSDGIGNRGIVSLLCRPILTLRRTGADPRLRRPERAARRAFQLTSSPALPSLGHGFLPLESNLPTYSSSRRQLPFHGGVAGCARRMDLFCVGIFAIHEDTLHCPRD